MRYIIISDSSIHAFQKRVEKAINEGWELYGSPFFADENGMTPEYCQAVIGK